MERDGTRYLADSTGHIHVDNSAHAEQIASNGKRYIHARITGFGEGSGDRCACGFLPHRFSSSCPRCGRYLKET